MSTQNPRKKPVQPPFWATGPHTFFAVAAPGLEGVLLAETSALPGIHTAAQVEGGVEFSGPLEVGLRANVHLRVASRVLLRIGTVRARVVAQLRAALAQMPWDALLPRDEPLDVRASASRCRLFHTGAITDAVIAGIADKAGARANAKDLRTAAPDDEAEDEGRTSRVQIRGQNDVWVVSLDMSGALLHKRGFRLQQGKAPLRETLAAGLLALAEHDPTRPFVDGMCGSGTLALEAGARALRRAPGIARSFAFERWPALDRSVWTRLREDARAKELSAAAAPLFAFDADAQAVARTRANAERAGLSSALTVEQALFGTRTVDGTPGLVVLNPPYGRRLGTRATTERLFRDIGRGLRARFAGWRAAIIVPDKGLAHALGFAPRATHTLSNGGLRVQLMIFDVPIK